MSGFDCADWYYYRTACLQLPVGWQTFWQLQMTLVPGDDRTDIMMPLTLLLHNLLMSCNGVPGRQAGVNQALLSKPVPVLFHHMYITCPGSGQGKWWHRRPGRRPSMPSVVAILKSGVHKAALSESVARASRHSHTKPRQDQTTTRPWGLL